MVKLHLFFKLFMASFVLSLLAFALIPEADLLFLLKALALGTALSVAIAVLYPQVRGVQQGDQVSVVTSSMIPALFGKGGIAISNGKLNSQIRIRLDNGREAVGVVESYNGLLTLPRVRLLYEEKLVE